MKRMLWIYMICWLCSTIGYTAFELPGDLNDDGVVDNSDLVLLKIFLSDSFSNLSESAADVNNDGLVNAVDLTWLINRVWLNIKYGGDLYEVDSIVGNLRYVPAGTFIQGSSIPEPCSPHWSRFTHTLTKNLAVMETEISRQMWADLKMLQPTLPTDPTNLPTSMSNPVQYDTWFEAILFANLLSIQQGLSRCYYLDAEFTIPITSSDLTNDVPIYCDWDANGFRLPTEGEWEYFCRAGTTTPFWIDEPNYTDGNCNLTSTLGMYPMLETAAWFGANYAGSTHAVGQKAPNPWGLHDVHGNVVEWCWDRYGDYPTGSVIDYRGGPSDWWRMLRGGGSSNRARECLSSQRGTLYPNQRVLYVGFRLVRGL